MLSSLYLSYFYNFYILFSVLSIDIELSTCHVSSTLAIYIPLCASSELYSLIFWSNSSSIPPLPPYFITPRLRAHAMGLFVLTQ
jgi:hypothetical protein